MGRFGGYGYFRVFRLVQPCKWFFFSPDNGWEIYTWNIFIFVSLLTWELMPHFWPQTGLLLCAMVRRWPLSILKFNLWTPRISTMIPNVRSREGGTFWNCVISVVTMGCERFWDAGGYWAWTCFWQIEIMGLAHKQLHFEYKILIASVVKNKIHTQGSCISRFLTIEKMHAQISFLLLFFTYI